MGFTFQTEYMPADLQTTVHDDSSDGEETL